MDEIVCGILVVGAGAAGLRAALEAAWLSKGKLSICLASKIPPPHGGSTPLANYGVAAPLHPEEGDTPELLAKDIVNMGSPLSNEQQARELAMKAASEVILADGLGMPWSRRLDGRIAQRWGIGHSVARIAYAGERTGLLLLNTLLPYALQAGVKLLPRMVLAGLDISQARIRGVLLYDIAHDRPVLVEAKAVILAVGGYTRALGSSVANRDSTGEAHVVALEAGLILRNPDLASIELVVPGVTPLPHEVIRCARLASRASVVKEEHKSISPREYEVLMNQVEYADLTPCIDLLEEKYPKTLAMISSSMPLEKVNVRPEPLATVGGILVDERYRALLLDGKRVEGLWVIGEAAYSSAQGARILIGCSLMEALVSAMVSAQEAVKYATREPLPRADKRNLEQQLERILGSEGENPEHVIEEGIRLAQNMVMGSLDEATLTKAAKLAETPIAASRPRRVFEAYGVKGVVKILLAAVQARKSRACHVDVYISPRGVEARCTPVG